VIYLLDSRVKKWFSHYFVQCLLAGITIAIILTFLNLITEAVIVAALGASTFIVFAMPGKVIARPRNLIGGHFIGVICGSLSFFWLRAKYGDYALASDSFFYIFLVALTVTLSIFFMCITNMEHPPASSTALGLIVHGCQWRTVVFILLSVSLLAVAKHLLRNYLKDLIE